MFEFKGGIQVFSLFLLKALLRLKNSPDIDVYLKHDQKATGALELSANFHCCGVWPTWLRTLRFFFMLLVGATFQKPALIILTHLNFSPVAYIIRLFFRVPYWIVAHGVESWQIKNLLTRYAFRSADKILAVSHFTRQQLIDNIAIDPNKVAILPNTYNPDDFRVANKPEKLLSRLGLRDDQPVILTVARLDQDLRYKGYDDILYALPEVQKIIPDVHYVLLGKGGDERRIRKIINELNVEQSTTLTGFVPDDELKEYYNLCDLFAMPSQGEGFGIVFLEALASGKPCISGDSDGSRDPLSNGRRGVLVPAGDRRTLASALISILQKSYPNPLLYQPLALRAEVISEFGFEAFTKTVEKYLEEELL